MKSAFNLVFLILARCTHLVSSLSLSSLSSSSPADSLTVRIGSRASKLALIQTTRVATALEQSGASTKITTEIVPINTSGDVKKVERDSSGGGHGGVGGDGDKTDIATQALPLAIQGVDFTGALDEAILNGNVDVAVHSLKDIPPECRWNAQDDMNIHINQPRVVIGAYLGPRASPYDVLVTRQKSIKSMTIQSFPYGAKIGSSSIRRQAQIKAHRPDIQVVNVRGNVDARLEALENGEVDALILAQAGLERLDFFSDEENGDNSVECKEHRGCYFHTIPTETMLPGVGQGIVAMTCRSDNDDIINMLQSNVDDEEVRIAAVAERAFLDVVQSISPWKGRPPLAAYMSPPSFFERMNSVGSTRSGRNNTGDDNKSTLWTFRGLLATPNGSQIVRVKHTLSSEECNEATAYELGKMAGNEIIGMAGNDFLEGYY